MPIGRRREWRALAEQVDGANRGGATLVLRGDAGIGKSFLLEAARTHAVGRGFRVLATSGVQSETNLPFAALHRLLRPILDAIERLPEPQIASAKGVAEKMIGLLGSA